MLLFNHSSDITICLTKDAPDAVRLAARDLQRDLRRLAGRENGFPVVSEASSPCVTVETAVGETESYSVSVDERGVHIVGGDTLGTVFGIYAFEHKCLGILPVWRVTDVFPKTRDRLELEETHFSSPPRAVRFRGWFLNDEDLLTDFKEGGGKRNIDYPFYQNVMHPEVLDMVLETALRMEINLMIPSSFVDVMNPDEERLIAETVRRGFFVTQHHVEPCGVSYFAADAYMKKHGEEGETVSFLTNRPRMEEIWRCYAERWAKYGDRVIWQLGLRGKADQAVWKSDPTVPSDPAGRGAIITDAIATQYRIISEVTGGTDFLSSSTLWLEAAALYGEGHLTLPKDTMVVFSDIGCSQMMGGDFYTVPRLKGTRYGIYYHVAFQGDGPHVGEGCDPMKMAFTYKEAAKANSLYYSILNVSNLRPVFLSTWLNARLLCEPGRPAWELLAELVEEIYGEHATEILPLYKSYYVAIADFGKEELIARCKRDDFHFHDFGPLPFAEFPATDGALRHFGLQALNNGHRYLIDRVAAQITLLRSLMLWRKLRKKADAILMSLPEEYYFCLETTLYFQVLFMEKMTVWCLGCYKIGFTPETEKKAKGLEEATEALEAICRARKCLERGPWQGWHRGEKKIHLYRLLAMTKRVYDMKVKK